MHHKLYIIVKRYNSMKLYQIIKSSLCRIVAPEYGLMNLQLIPMLVGFFTYKIATFTQAIEEAITIVGNDAQIE